KLMKENFYFCLTPDFQNKNGLFLSNPGDQFWYNATTGTVVGPPANPPHLKHSGTATKDQVGFAIEVTQTGSQDDYTVDDITISYTIRQGAVCLPSSTPATVASPFRNGNNSIVCQQSGKPVSKNLMINGRKFKTTKLFDVHVDGSVNSVSAYEISLVAAVSNSGDSFEFSADPEMEVDNS